MSSHFLTLSNPLSFDVIRWDIHEAIKILCALPKLMLDIRLRVNCKRYFRPSSGMWRIFTYISGSLESEKERECVYVCEKKERMCACVRREWVCVRVWEERERVCMCDKERERVCVCEKERECVCECAWNHSPHLNAEACVFFSEIRVRTM